MKWSKRWCFALSSLSMIGAFVCASCTGGDDTRLETRGSIAGVVHLTDIPGLNDLSRVSIDLGRGEGVLLPKEDGSFEASDLEPDLYEVRIIYSGGLTSDATESAYQSYARDFTLREGAHVDLGDIDLELGTGTIEGQLTPPDGESFPDDAVLSLFGRNAALEDGDKGGEVSAEYTQALFQSGVDPDGNVSFSNVTVGNYEAVVTGEGIRGCLGIMRIEEHLQVQQLDSFDVPSTQVRFLSGTDQVFGSDSGRTWFLQEGGVTVNVVAGFADQMRTWLGDVDASDRPDFTPFTESRVFTEEELSEGANVASFQFKDLCGFTSDIETLTLVRDTVEPDIQNVRLHFGDQYSTSSTVNLSVEATDAFSDSLEMRLVQCTVAGEGEAVFAATSDTYTCDPLLDTLDWLPYQEFQSITFAGDGARGVQVQVRDGSENETVIKGTAVIIDSVPPENVTVMVEDGSGVITTPQATVNLTAEDASYMKLGTAAGLANIGWLSYDNQATVTFSADDGDKLLYTRFKDVAGNETDEFVTAVTLDTTGSLAGTVFVEDLADASMVEVSLLGTSFRVNATANGGWSMMGVPAGVYTVQVEMTGALENLYGPTQYGAAVEATQQTDVVDLYLELSRGNVSGTVLAEVMAGAEASHAGILVQLTPLSVASSDGDGGIIGNDEDGGVSLSGDGGSGESDTDVGRVYSTNSVEDGSYAFSGVVVGSYRLEFSKVDYISEHIEPILIQVGQTAVVGERTLLFERASLKGTVLLEDQADPSILTVNLVGTQYEASVASDGTFLLENVAPGNYVGRITPTGDATARYPTVVLQIALTSGTLTQLNPVTMLLGRGEVTGFVTLEVDTDYSNVLVELPLLGMSAFTNESGQYTIPGVAVNAPNPPYTLRLNKDGYQTQETNTVTVTHEQSTVMPSMELLVLRASIQGNVFLEDSADPSILQITLEGTQYETSVASDGTFTMEDVMPGVYTIRITPTGDAAARYPIVDLQTTLAAGSLIQLAPITMLLGRGEVTGSVTLEGESDYADVLVELPLLGMSTFTDESGQYTIQGVAVNAPNPPYTLRLSKDGYQSQETNTVTVTHEQSTVMPSMELLVLRASIQGSVFLEDSADPSILQITLDGTQYETSVGLDGTFTMEDVMPGIYTIRITPTGEAAARYPIVDLQTTLMAGSLTQLAPITMLLGRGEVTGSVTLEVDTDYSNVLVELPLLGMSAFTDESGQYTIQGVAVNAPNPPYTLRLSKDGYQSQETNTVTVTHEQSTLIPSMELLVLRASIQGSVFLEDFADPSIIQVSLVGTESSATVTIEGSYVLAELLPGSYLMRFEATGSFADRYRSLDVQVMVTAGQVMDVAPVTLPLTRGNLLGTVVLEDAQSPEGALVEVTELGQGGTVNIAGAFHLTGVVAGIYIIRVSKPGYASVSLTGIVVEDGQDTTVPEVTLPLEYGDIAGGAIVEDGNAEAQIQLSLGGTTHLASASPDGSWLIEGVAPGPYVLTCSVIGAFAAQYQSLEVAVTVVANQVAQIPTFTLNRARGAVVGMVTLEDETNHSGVSVSLSNSTDQFQAITNGLGSFDLSAIPTGNYQLVIEKDDFVTHTVTTVPVNVGETLDIGTVQLLIHEGSAFGVATFDDAEDHSGIQILFTGAEGSAVTVTDGSWDFPEIKPGGYYVRAVYEGYTAPTDAVYIGAGQAVELQDIVMTRKRGTVTGFVELENMESHSGATLILLSDVPELNETFQTTSGPDGNYMFSVPVGNYNGIRATKEHYADTELLSTITVTDYGVANADSVIFLVGVSNTVSGKATLADLPLGPHDGIQVTFDGLTGTETEGESQSTNSDTDGDFAFDTVPVGSYTVSYTYPADPNREPVTRGVEVTPGLPIVLLPAELRELYLVIDDNAAYSTDTAVDLNLGATDAAEYRVSNEAFPDETSGWLSYTSNAMSWDLSAGDGTKTVYAQFKTDIGEITAVLQSSIILDITATIADFDVSPGLNFARWDVMHLRLDADGEPGGAAYVAIGVQDAAVTYPDNGNYYEVLYDTNAPQIDLYDDGSNGDTVADDGIYERDYLIEEPFDAPLGIAVGYFTDPHGNVSAVATQPLTIQAVPSVENIAVEVFVALGEATITWTTDEKTSTLFEWGLDALYGSQVVESAETIEHEVVLGDDTPLAQSTVYHFGITATDEQGNATQTTNQVFSVRPLQPYLPVAMAGDGRVDLRWECPDQNNIVGYNIRRAEENNQDGGVGSYVLLNDDGPYMHEALLYNDFDVENGKTYHYIISSVDAPGIESIDVNNLVTGPPAPELLEATPMANQGPTLVSGGLGQGIIVWSSSGSPYIIEDNVEVELGSTLVVAPGTEVYFDGRGPSQNENTHLTVRGRLAVYGDRGTAFIRDEADQWVENDEGMVTFSSMRSNDPGFVPAYGTWDGIDFASTSPEGHLDLYTGTYKSGNLFYRAKLSYGTQPAISASTGTMALIRSTIDYSNAALTAYGKVLIKSSQILHNGQGSHAGPGPALSLGSTQNPGQFLFLDSIFRNNIGGPFIETGAVQTYNSTLRILGSKFLTNSTGSSYGYATAVFAKLGQAYIAETLFQGNLHTNGQGGKGSLLFGGNHWGVSDYVWVVSDCTFIENERAGGPLKAIATTYTYTPFRIVSTEILQGHWQPQGSKIGGYYDAVNVHIHNGGLTGGSSVLSSTFTGDFDMSSTIVDWNTNSTATLAYSQFQGHLGDGIYVKAKSGVTLTGNTFDVPSHATGLAVENKIY